MIMCRINHIFYLKDWKYIFTNIFKIAEKKVRSHLELWKELTRMKQNQCLTCKILLQELATIYQQKKEITHQLLQISQQSWAGNFLEFAWIILKTVYKSTEGKTHTLYALLILLGKPVCQKRQRIGHKVKFICMKILAAIGCDCQCCTLGIDTEEIQVHKAGCNSTLKKK
jgi:hypothetical protein